MNEMELRKRLQDNFHCLKCGDCCQKIQVITIYEQELLPVAQFLGLTLEEFKDRYVGVQPNGNLTIKNTNPCVFFDKSKGCTIHPVKFQSCRAWPFLDSALIGKKIGTYFKSCPGQHEMVKNLEKYL